jgi:hypothetical protein
MLWRRDFRWRTRRASIAAEARFPGADSRAGGIPDGGHHGAPGEGGGVPDAGGRRAGGVHRGRGHGEVVDALRPPLRISRDFLHKYKIPPTAMQLNTLDLVYDIYWYKLYYMV